MKNKSNGLNSNAESRNVVMKNRRENKNVVMKSKSNGLNTNAESRNAVMKKRR